MVVRILSSPLPAQETNHKARATVMLTQTSSHDGNQSDTVHTEYRCVCYKSLS